MTSTDVTCRGRTVMMIAAVWAAGLALSACQSTSSSTHEELAPEDDAPIFSSSIFGVKASPRVTRSKTVRKGGGRDQVGKPYMVKGKWYYPKEEPGYTKTGTASWYGANFHGRLTANGEIYDMYHLSAAHPTFPLPSYARVTNQKNASSIIVRVNDRGPYVHDRVLDVSSRAAQLLGFQHDGVADVKVEYVGRAPLEGDDTKVLMASYQPGSVRPEDAGLATGTMIASRSDNGWRSFFGFGSRSEPAETATAFSSQSTDRPQQPLISKTPASTKTKPAPEPSVEDLIGRYDIASATSSEGRNLLSYASTPVRSGSLNALEEIASTKAVAELRERIEIGQISDVTRLLVLEGLTSSYGEIVEQKDALGSSFALLLQPDQNVDAKLKQLWEAGFEDAFIVRED